MAGQHATRPTAATVATLQQNQQHQQLLHVHVPGATLLLVLLLLLLLLLSSANLQLNSLWAQITTTTNNYQHYFDGYAQWSSPLRDGDQSATPTCTYIYVSRLMKWQACKIFIFSKLFFHLSLLTIIFSKYVNFATGNNINKYLKILRRTLLPSNLTVEEQMFVNCLS